MKTVLIVDDEKNIRVLYREVFEKEGYKVIVASNGKEGLSVCKENKIDIVILDIRLPDMDGMEILSKLAKEESAPPIILNSAYAGYEKDVNSWLAEAYLIKSSDLSELKDRVKEILKDK
ncbi:MAG: response regulator [Candidatus Firestonebacteria bacterium]